MTPEQLAALKVAVLADPTLSAVGRNDTELARLLNLPTSFVGWRTNVTIDETGNAWQGTDIDGMSSLNMQRLQLLISSTTSGVFDMSRADRRAGFENPFGANVSGASRVAMRAAWKRFATRAESVFATGTGTDATPGLFGYEGSVSINDIGQMWNQG
jgi:hypothetical protein